MPMGNAPPPSRARVSGAPRTSPRAGSPRAPCARWTSSRRCPICGARGAAAGAPASRGSRRCSRDCLRRARSSVRGLIGALMLLLLPATAGAQRATRDWPAEDRAVIGDFSVVTTVAATFDRVFATSRSMLVIWRPLERRWEGPFEPGDPGALERVFLAAADPLDQSLWMVRPDGWLRYQPDMRVWQRGIIPGRVNALVFD